MATTVSIELTSTVLTPDSRNTVALGQNARTPSPHNSIRSSTSATSNAAQATTSPASTATIASQPSTTSSFSVPTIKVTLVYIGQFLAAVAALYATYVGLSLAAWTSVKDFRDDCRNQNTTYGIISLACRDALGKVLLPPPRFGSFLPSLAGRKLKRMQFDGMMHPTPIKPSSLCLMWTEGFGILFVCCILLIRMFRRRLPQQPPPRRAHVHWLFCQPFHVFQNTVNAFPRTRDRQNLTPPGWVPNAVARQLHTTFTTSLEYGPQTTSLRKRVTSAGDSTSHEVPEDSDWLPSGRCITDAGNDEADMDNKDYKAFPCKVCREILGQRTPVELIDTAEHMLDVDRYRCKICASNVKLDLIGVGSFICNDFSYSCSRCGKKYIGSAILSGGQAFCNNCFECRSCLRKIGANPYVQTSEGIVCADCHRRTQGGPRSMWFHERVRKTKQIVRERGSSKGFVVEE